MRVAADAVDLTTDRTLVDEYLTELLCRSSSKTRGAVQQAVRYAVLGGAQRIRPILSLRIARLVRAPQEPTLRAAAAIELLHCASLIVDDLPCMDDSPVRRDKPSVHIQFGEATAVLAAFALVSLSARILTESSYSDDEHQRLAVFQLHLLRSLDCSGLIDGQAMDLHLDGVHKARSTELMELKTVPLFQLAIRAGTMLVNLDENETALLGCFGREFGLAFQMADDLLDGDDIDRALLADKLTTLRAVVAPFGPHRRELDELVDYLYGRIADAFSY